jgi:PEP-CTERM motif
MIATCCLNNSRFRFLLGAATRCLLVAGPLAIAPAVVLTSAVPAHAGSYTFQNIIDPLNPTFTQALGINGSGTIAGYGNATTFNGFTLTLPSSFTRLNVVGADGGTQVTGIDAAGDTVGFSITGGVTNGFANTGGQGGTFTTVDATGFAFTQLLGINGSGTTAAGYWTHDAAGATNQLAGFVTGGPGFTSPIFRSINNLLPTNFNSQATGVNNSGDIVGFYQYNSVGTPLFSAFSDIGGTITPFQFPGSVDTQALGVNNLGEIVGDYVDTGGLMHGFLDNAGTFTMLDPTGSTATTINGINDSGTVVGFYVNANGSTIGTEGTMVPEPSTWAMMLAGFAGLGFLGYRKVRQGKPAA